MGERKGGERQGGGGRETGQCTTQSVSFQPQRDALKINFKNGHQKRHAQQSSISRQCEMEGQQPDPRGVGQDMGQPVSLGTTLSKGCRVVVGGIF